MVCFDKLSEGLGAHAGGVVAGELAAGSRRVLRVVIHVVVHDAIVLAFGVERARKSARLFGMAVRQSSLPSNSSDT